MGSKVERERDTKAEFANDTKVIIGGAKAAIDHQEQLLVKDSIITPMVSTRGHGVMITTTTGYVGNLTMLLERCSRKNRGCNKEIEQSEIENNWQLVGKFGRRNAQQGRKTEAPVRIHFSRYCTATVMMRMTKTRRVGP